MSTDQEKMQKIIEAISKAARADGKITQEEAALLESIQVNALIYDQYLEEALEDNYITEEEKEMLDGFKQQILDDAWDVAKISEGVSDDELKMLEVLLHSLKEE